MISRSRPGHRGPHVEHRAAQLSLTLAAATAAPPITLTRAQERAFRAQTRRVGLIGAWYAATDAQLHRADRRPASLGLLPWAAAGTGGAARYWLPHPSPRAHPRETG